MPQWNIKAWSLFVLSCVVLVMLLIVVLPGVDLPDTAFHHGSAPGFVHARVTTAPATLTIAAVFHLRYVAEPPRFLYQPGALVIASGPNFRPILLRSIRC
jgi:hypothetical protein